MKLTTMEQVYLRGYNKNLRFKTVSQALGDAFEGEKELQCCYPNNTRRVSDIVRRIVLSSHHAGLMAKSGDHHESQDVDTTGDQAIIISSIENPNTGIREPISRAVIDALIDSGVKFIGLYLCSEGEDSSDKTFICIVDVRPDSEDHKVFVNGASTYNLDIRLTSREWFN